MPTSSSAPSSGCTRPASSKARVSVWPPCSASSAATAATCGPRARWRKAPPSALRCPSPWAATDAGVQRGAHQRVGLLLPQHADAHQAMAEGHRAQAKLRHAQAAVPESAEVHLVTSRGRGHGHPCRSPSLRGRRLAGPGGQCAGHQMLAGVRFGRAAGARPPQLSVAQPELRLEHLGVLDAGAQMTRVEDTEVLEAEFWLSDGELRWSCTCGAAEAHPCEHLVASALATWPGEAPTAE